MKTIQNELPLALRLWMLMKKIAAWFKKNEKPMRSEKAISQLKLRSLNAEVLAAMVNVIKLQGSMNFPAPPKALTENLAEMNAALKQWEENDLLSEKKKRIYTYKLFQKWLNKLIHKDKSILTAGFNVKKKRRLET